MLNWQHCKITPAKFLFTFCLSSSKMKLNCRVTISNRLLPNLNISSASKYQNAVLAVMKPPKDETIYLLLITSKNKSGTRFKIRGNIEKVFGQFRNEGKATIRFKEPPHDLCINADKIQLGNFMILLKKICNNEENNVPEIHRMTIPQLKSQSGQKMEIKTKSDYPVLQGFPSNLQILNISNCQLKRVDSRILKLKSLTSLCLDKNNLTDIPVEFKMLTLKHLSLSCNKLGKNIQCWNFLSWPLSGCLEYLDLSGNEMKVFPATLTRFSKLKILKLSNISVNKIPFRICLLPNLQELDLSRNKLMGLPGTVTKRYRKFDKLDMSNNENLSDWRNTLGNAHDDIHLGYVPTLLELSIRSTLDNRLPYSESNLPLRLVPVLDQAKLCICGKPCARDFGPIITSTEKRSLANTFISSDRDSVVSIEYRACCPRHLNLKK